MRPGLRGQVFGRAGQQDAPAAGATFGADRAACCLGPDSGVEGAVMIRFFDMDDRARLPWRFFGAARSILGRL